MSMTSTLFAGPFNLMQPTTKVSMSTVRLPPADMGALHQQAALVLSNSVSPARCSAAEDRLGLPYPLWTAFTEEEAAARLEQALA